MRAARDAKAIANGLIPPLEGAELLGAVGVYTLLRLCIGLARRCEIFELSPMGGVEAQHNAWCFLRSLAVTNFGSVLTESTLPALENMAHSQPNNEHGQCPISNSGVLPSCPNKTLDTTNFADCSKDESPAGVDEVTVVLIEKTFDALSDVATHSYNAFTGNTQLYGLVSDLCKPSTLILLTMSLHFPLRGLFSTQLSIFLLYFTAPVMLVAMGAFVVGVLVGGRGFFLSRAQPLRDETDDQDQKNINATALAVVLVMILVAGGAIAVPAPELVKG
ncbi:hypothetical protein HDU93_002092, partial [Gonapodya sp. JEL0774]